MTPPGARRPGARPAEPPDRPRPAAAATGPAGDGVATATWTAAIAAGDERAFARFYDAWFDAALALARTVARGDDALALDVVQDVMLKVVRKLPPLSSEAAVRAWLLRAIVSAVVDRLRAEQRRRRRELRVSSERSEGRTDGPLELLVIAERQQWVQEQLARLPALDRELVLARFGDSAAVAAAARSFGLGADAAHGRLRRCLQRLRQAAREWFDG